MQPLHEIELRFHRKSLEFDTHGTFNKILMKNANVEKMGLERKKKVGTEVRM